MSTSEEDVLKRRYREFLELMPVTLAVAGLPENDGPRSFSNDQMEARAKTLATAYKVARQAVREVLGVSNKES